jgi:hypothetical protein
MPFTTEAKKIRESVAIFFTKRSYGTNQNNYHLGLKTRCSDGTLRKI